MRYWIKTYRYHFFLIAIAMALHALVSGLLQLDAQHRIYPDSESYFEAARNVYMLHSGHNYRPMVMAAINGIPYLFGFPDSAVYDFSYYLNLFCWLVTGLLLFEMLKAVVTEKTAFFLAVLFFTFVGNIVLIHHLLTEPIYTLFIVLSFYLLQRYYQRGAFWMLALALSILVCSMLVRPGSKWLAVLLVLYFGKELFRHYKAKAMWWLYGSFLLVLVQCAGIQYQFGNFTISYIDSVTYYNYLGSKALAYQHGKEYNLATDPRTYYIFSLTPPQIQQEARRDLLRQLQENKKGLCYAYASNLWENSTSGNIPILDCQNRNHAPGFESRKALLYGLSQWQNRLFTAFGLLLAIFCLWKDWSKRPFFALVTSVIGYIVVTSGISCSQGDRFHLVVFPFVLVLLARILYSERNLNLQ